MTGVLTIDDLIADKKHSTFFAEVVTGKSGGLSTGADITTATNQVTGQVKKTIPAIVKTVEDDFAARVAGMAFTRVGTFTAGATLTDMRQTLLWELSQGGDGHEYGWSGALPKVVLAGSTPASTGGVGAGAWVDRSDVTLRAEINIVQKRFICVADMIADTTLFIGQLVETIGYYNGWAVTAAKPKGGNRYEIVAAGTGTDDSGSFITLSNGLQAKALFVEGEYTPHHWGAKGDNVNDDTISIQSACDYLGGLTRGGLLTWLNGVYNTTDTIDIPHKVNWKSETVGIRDGSDVMSGAVIYKKHANNCVEFNKTIAGRQFVDGVGIVGIDATNTGGSGYVINASGVVLKNTQVQHIYLHSYVVGNGVSTSYSNQLIDCYSNNPTTGKNFVIDSTLFHGEKLISDGGTHGIYVTANATNFDLRDCHFEGFTDTGAEFLNSQGVTSGKMYVACTNSSALFGVRARGSANGLKLNGFQIARSSVGTSGSIGLDVSGTAVGISFKDFTITGWDIGVNNTTTGTNSSTRVIDGAIGTCNTGIYSNANYSRYSLIRFVSSVNYDINHVGGTGGVWDKNIFSRTGDNAIKPTYSGQSGNFNKNCVKNNIGYVTRNKGHASAITTGATITHGLSVTPVTNGSTLLVTCETAGVTSPITVQGPTSTTFTLVWTGTASINVSWEAALVCDF